MGAWSVDAFGNDTACDWKQEFLRDSNAAKLSQAIAAVVSAEGYVDEFIGSRCIAASEVIARAVGYGGTRNSYTEEIDRLIDRHELSIPTSLIEAALVAVDRIAGEDSELVELWGGDDPDSEWCLFVGDLRRRLVNCVRSRDRAVQDD